MNGAEVELCQAQISLNKLSYAVIYSVIYSHASYALINHFQPCIIYAAMYHIYHMES